jgi:hypothetical protein
METPFIVLDDILHQETADTIEMSLKRDIPWRLISDITYAGDKRNTPAFAHVFKNNEWGNYMSPHINLITPIIDAGCKAVNFKAYELIKARSFLQVPFHKNYTDVKLDALHVDQPFPHLVLLYYVFDADGDTIIVNERSSTNTKLYDLDANSYEIIGSITPKKNRLVIFNGDYYHTAYQPTNGLRCVININLIGAFL